MADCLRGPVDRASASGAEGRGFESRRRHKKVRHPSGVRDTTGTGPMRRVPTASTLSWHSKRLRVVAMAGGARHIRAGGWRPASGWTRKPAYRRVVQMAARRSLEPYVAGSNPAPPANHSRRWTRSRELSVVEGVAGLVPAAADPWMVFRPVLRPYEADAYRPGIGGRVDRRPQGV